MNAGRWLILGIFAAAIVAAGAAWLHRLRQTDDVLAFWGPEVVDAIARGTVVAIERQEDGTAERHEITTRRGMPNVRHTLLQDFTFDWASPAGGQTAGRDSAEGNYALEFTYDGKTKSVEFGPEFSQAWLRGSPQRRNLQPQAAKYFRAFFAEQFSDDAPQP